MTKDDKINIKLEIVKDKNSGDFIILTHFNQKAPNISMDKEGFIWIPTYEEKDLINDVFQLVSPNSSYTQIKNSNQKIADKKKLYQSSDIQIKNNKEKYKNNIEINKEQDIFKIVKNETINEEIVKNSPKYYKDINQQSFINKNKDIKIKNKNEDRKEIIKTNSNAIEKALQKHLHREQINSYEDEESIIDQFLNQKKKEKFSKR